MDERPPTLPRWLLLGAAGLVVLTLLAAGIGRLVGPHIAMTAAALHSRSLSFADRSDGAVVITDAQDGRLLEVMPAGSNGFLRATMRGLARTRHQSGLGRAAPFRVTEWADGRVTLDDPATGAVIELNAFGSTNAAVFARLLTLRGTAS